MPTAPNVTNYAQSQRDMDAEPVIMVTNFRNEFILDVENVSIGKLSSITC